MVYIFIVPLPMALVCRWFVVLHVHVFAEFFGFIDHRCTSWIEVRKVYQTAVGSERRCNGINARCKSCACAKAGRACNGCLLSKHCFCHNYTTSITASSNMSTNDFPAHNHFPCIRPHSPIPSSCLYLNHFRSCHLYSSSTPSSFITPSPAGSLVVHPFHSQNQLHVSTLIPEPKSPGQGPFFSYGSHFSLNEF